MGSRLRGWKDLVVDAVEHTTRLVEATHRGVSRKTFGALRMVEPIAPVVDGVERVEAATSRLAYGSVVAVDRAVGAALDLVLPDDAPDEDEAPVPLRSDAVGSRAWLLDAGLGSVNGIVGDYLAARGSGLAIPTQLRRGDHRLPHDPIALCCALPDAQGRICVFVHGLMTTEWSWTWAAEAHHEDATTSYATRLEAEHDFTSVLARYNTGRPIARNGADLAAELEAVLDGWPVPVTELVLVGHSMGGLVLRHALATAREERHRWIHHVSHVVCLGSPHLGAPLAKAGRVLERVLGAVDLPAPYVISRLLQARSEGITDLEDGFPFRADEALLGDIELHLVAGTLADPRHPVSVALGDALVREASATGGLDGAAVFPGLSHLALANHPDVYDHLVERIV